MELDAGQASVALVARIILGATLLWAGIAKFKSRRSFADSIKDFQLVPSSMSRYLSWLLPPVEAILGAFLILGLFIRWTALGSLVLLLVFTGAVVVNVVRGHQTRCLCFGSRGDEGKAGWWTVYRNLGLILLAGIVVLFHPLSLETNSLFNQTPETFFSAEQAIATVVLSAVAVVIWLLIGEALRYRSGG